MSKKAKVHQRQPTIAVCVIARNEEAFIAGCLDSARPYVDELIVVDTGSTDATVQIAREHGARVTYFEWCDDFSAARNAAIEAATSDWILMLDADEALEADSGPVLRQYASMLPKSVLAYAVVIENQRRGGRAEEIVRHTTTRFFPRRDNIRFVGAIHEDLVDLDEPMRTETHAAIQIRVAHYGYDPELYVARAKDARNMRLLELAYQREPESSRVLYYLGQQSFVAKRYAEAIGWFEKFAERPGGAPRFWLVDTYQMWLEALLQLGDAEGFRDVAERGQRENTLSAVSRETLANDALRQRRPEVALKHLLAAVSPEVPVGMVTPSGVGGWRTHSLLAEVHRMLGDHDAVFAEMDVAFTDTPATKRLELAVKATEFALSINRHAEALHWVSRASEASDELEVQQRLLKLALRALRGAPPEALSADRFQALDVALATQDWQAAYESGMRLALGRADALARLLFLARALQERQAHAAAADLLGRAIDVYPPSNAVYWPLIQVLTALGRYDDALAATEILRQSGEFEAKAA